MELLESVGPRPRQARYQAALRPDITFIIDFTALCGLVHHVQLPQAPVWQCCRRKRRFEDERAHRGDAARIASNVHLEAQILLIAPHYPKI